MGNRGSLSAAVCRKWAAWSIFFASLGLHLASAQLPEPKYPLNRQDLIAAMPADDNHRALVFASRHWRKVISICMHTLDPCCH